MHVRMIVTYFKGKLTPKEGHIDCPVDLGPEALEQCFKILCSKHVELDKMLPKQLKLRQFNIVVHGEYLQGFDYRLSITKGNLQTMPEWVYDKPIFNILQLGIPEDERPLIKT